MGIGLVRIPTELIIQIVITIMMVFMEMSQTL